MLLIYLLTLLIAAVAYYLKYQYSYWQRHDMPYLKDACKIPFGCLESVSRREKSMGMAIYDAYMQTKERFVGIYLLYRPAVLVRDIDLVRHVLAQDFASFHDRGVYVDEKKDPLSAGLFSMQGKSWRTMRNKLTPLFSSGKLKGMFGTADDIGNKMINHLDTVIPEQGSAEIDMKEIFTTYAIDLIASVIFGLDINSYENPKNTFRTLVTIARRNTFFSAIFGMLIFLCPPVAKIMFKLGFKNEVALKLMKIMGDTIEYREKNHVIRKDMLQLLMQLRNTGKINEDDDNWKVETAAVNLKSMPMELIAAQGFIFYIAGQETTASTAAFTIFELAQYPDLLYRAQQEVQTVLEQNGGKFSYEAMQKMEFLELCMLETLRKYPGLPLLNRECTQDYPIPGTSHVIKQGTPVVISLFGIHRDPEYFPDPEQYEPERFSEESRNYNPNAYMPFGEGPRHCIAQRMGKVTSKLAVAKVLAAFNIEIMEKREIEIDNHSIGIIPKGGVNVRLSQKRAH